MLNQVCQICGRDLGGTLVDEHHLVPKAFKGKATIALHKICHRKIHSVFTERELLNHYHTVDRIKDHEQIKKFAEWVAKKPIDFYDVSLDSRERKSKRRR
jgi:5-methylcytosine-specific restriction endonuclease McrA